MYRSTVACKNIHLLEVQTRVGQWRYQPVQFRPPQSKFSKFGSSVVGGCFASVNKFVQFQGMSEMLTVRLPPSILGNLKLIYGSRGINIENLARSSGKTIRVQS